MTAAPRSWEVAFAEAAAWQRVADRQLRLAELREQKIMAPDLPGRKLAQHYQVRATKLRFAGLLLVIRSRK